MAVSLKLAEAFVDVHVNRAPFNAGLAAVIGDLGRLKGLGVVNLSLNRSAADASLLIFEQHMRASKLQANFTATLDRSQATASLNLLMQQIQAARGLAGGRMGGPGGGGGGGGGGGIFGGMLQVAGGQLMARATAAALAVPGQIGGAMFDAAKKASDLGESVSKVNVTFGPAAGEVIGKTDELAERFGVVKKEALDAAAAFGLMALAAGQTKEQAAATGNRFVQMGLDIASFHNITNAEAFEKLRSGLAGEIEPLRQIGILLSEDAVQAKALEMGLVGSSKEAKHLTQQQKVAVRTELIASQMGPAMGDLERTASSAANQLRKLQGDMENLTTEFGNELQGALRSGIDLARELGKVIADATGKGAPKAVGEVVKATVDATRTVVQGEGPGILSRLNLGLAQAMSAAFGKIGLGENFGKVKDAAEAMQREQEGGTAAATGMKLAAGPPTQEEQIAAMEKSGVPAQMELAAQSRAVAAAMAAAATTEVPGLGRGGLGAPGLDLAREQDRIQAEMFRREREAAGTRPGGRIGTAFAIKDTEEELEFQRSEVRAAREAANERGQDEAGQRATRAALAEAVAQQRILERGLAEMRGTVAGTASSRENLAMGAMLARPGEIPSEFRRKFLGEGERAEAERREAMAFIARPREEEHRPSQMFTDPADYATHAIQAALSAKDDSPKQTAEATKKGAVLLQALVDAIVPVTKITPGKPNAGMFIFQHD